MSLCVITLTEDTVTISADSRVCTATDEGTAYWMNDNGKKLYLVGDLIVFGSGVSYLVNNIMTLFKTSELKTVDHLSTITKIVVEELKNQPELIQQFGFTGAGLLDFTVVGMESTNEGDKPFMANIADNSEEIIKIYGSKKPKVIAVGAKADKARLEVEKLVLNTELPYSDIYKAVYERLVDEQIGGVLQVYTLHKEFGYIENFCSQLIDNLKLRKYEENKELFGHYILGSRVVIGDDDGIFTIEGPKLTILDRCEREVLKLGLLSERPDVFGMYVNRYASSDCSNKTITNVTGMNNDRGFYIDKIRNGITSNVFGLSQDGNLRLRTGDNNEVMIVDQNGLGLGSETWALAPFRVNYKGEAWLESLWATNAYIQNSKFINGHIEGSSLTLRDGGGVMKMFPLIGLWAGHEEFDDAPFSVDMQGNLKAHKAKLIGKKGEILIDTDAGFIDMDKFDIINVGKLVAEMLQVNTILADKSYVNDLTVNKLKTLPKDVNVGEFVDYIEIQDNYIRFITAKVNDKQHAKDSRDRLLYWQDAEKKILTTDNTGIIAYAYTFNPSDIKVKQEITFTGSGNDAQPMRIIGLGDGTPNGGKATETKYNGGLKTTYGQSNTGRERSIDLADDGIFINSDRQKVNITSKDLNVLVQDGVLNITHTSGSMIQMTENGNIILKAANDMVHEAGRNMSFKAARVDFNV